MNLKRGDVALARFPHLAGARGKKRPVVVVQADVYIQKVRHVIVAEVTKNLALAKDPTHLLIDVTTPEGKATGLLQNSAVACLLVVSMNSDRIDPVIGKLSPAMLQQLDGCLKAALELS